jgi:hypothetical protein
VPLENLELQYLLEVREQHFVLLENLELLELLELLDLL